MKKIVSVILALSMLFSLSACSKKTTEVNAESSETETTAAAVKVQDNKPAEPETEPALVETPEPIAPWDGSFETLQLLNHRDYNYYWGSARHSLIDVHYPNLALDETGRVHFPELEKSLEKMNREIGKYIEGSLEDLTEGAKESYAAMVEEYGDEAEDYYATFIDTYDPYIMRADSNAVSILMRNVSYTGGNHPNSVFVGYNFDTQSGKELKVEEVVTDMPAFAKLVREFIEKYYGDGALFEETDMDNLLNYSYSWVINNEGVSVYFNPYEIGPYASGVFMATIPFKGHEDMFNAKYTERAENYFQEIVENIPYYYDVDDDGNYEYIAAYQTGRPDSTLKTTTIVVDGKSASEENQVHSLRSFVVKNEGRTYAYQFMTIDSNYPYTKIYDLTSDEPRDVAAEYYWIPTVYVEKEAYEMIPNNADKVKLAMKMWLLGTYQALMDYDIGDQGIPSTDETCYEISAAPPLTFLKSVEFDVVNEEGEVIGTRKSHVADKLYLYRTDFYNFIDGKFEDGTIIRMKVDVSGDPYLVNGIVETELFDGIVYS